MMTATNRCILWWAIVLVTGALIVYCGLDNNQDILYKKHSKQFLKCIELAGKSVEETNILCHWLQNSKLLDQAARLQTFGIQSLDDVYQMNKDEKMVDVFGPEHWAVVQRSLPQNIRELAELKKQIRDNSPYIHVKDFSFESGRLVKELILVALMIWGLSRLAIIFGWIPDVCLIPSGRRNCIRPFDTDVRQIFLEFINGNRALARNAQVVFHWEEPMLVGNTVSFSVQFFQRWSRQPYPVSDGDSIRVNIRQGSNKIAAALQIGGTNSAEINIVKATFTVRKAGAYHIDISLGPIPINGSPFIKQFLPGQPEASKTSLVRPTSMVVCTAGVSHQLLLEPRDEYGNFCSWSHPEEQQKALNAFSLEIHTVGSSDVIQPLIQWLWVELMHRLMINVTVQEEGVYDARLKFNDVVINKGEFNMIVLSKNDTYQVEKGLGTRTATYETRLLSINGEKWTKDKKVFCTLSPKQIALKEYILGIIPRRLATFRLCPATKVTFKKSSSKADKLRTLVIEDGALFRVELTSKEAHLLAASYAQSLLKSIGGSETFVDKQGFFYQEIRKFHQKKPHEKLVLRIDRSLILDQSIKLTKSFSTSDWCKNFEIEFVGEQGLDWGGLRREWIELLCVSMFDRRQSGMFTSFSDDRQALVHPNPNMPPHCKLKYYEFAGKLVGKCLYESSLGPTYRQHIKARFTRSFLSQLIGLRINYKYFEHDDPQLYLSKIKYIEENDINDMELFFVEDEYDQQGKLLRTVELIPGGARLPVNNDNKLQYLDALAHQRLVNSVKDQIDAFIRGLTEIVPDNLLSIFDENELELLVCGQSEYTVSELKAHHAPIGSSSEFKKVLSWFWTAVTNFGPEEMSRLLQFITGSSQLPPGGLAELSPKLQISASPSFGILPTAHTCFNQLCLPDYESYEQFEKALLIAINEGTEGFGFV